MTPTDEQLSKLPKWAHEHITSLSRERDDATRRLKDYLDDQSESVVWTQDGIGREERRFIQTDQVYFNLPKGEICIRVVGEHLHVMGVGSLATHLVVLPKVTNVIDIGLLR